MHLPGARLDRVVGVQKPTRVRQLRQTSVLAWCDWCWIGGIGVWVAVVAVVMVGVVVDGGECGGV